MPNEAVPTSRFEAFLVRNFFPGLVGIGFGGLLILIGVLSFYFWHFHGPVVDNHSQWAQFGGFFGGTLGPALSFLALLGTLLALYISTNEIRRKQRDDAEEDKRRSKIVSHLLKDEIEQRWRGSKGIECWLKEHVAKESLEDIKAAEIFVNQFKIRPDDMIVFKLIGTSFPDYYFLEDPVLVSKIIHGHVLMRDLADFHEQAEKYLGDKTKWAKELAEFHKRLKEILESLNDCHREVLAKLSSLPDTKK